MVTGPCGRGCSLHGCSVTSHWGLFLLTPNREGNDPLQVQRVKWWAYWDYTEKHGGLKGCIWPKSARKGWLTNAGKEMGKEPWAWRYTSPTHSAMATRRLGDLLGFCIHPPLLEPNTRRECCRVWLSLCSLHTAWSKTLLLLPIIGQMPTLWPQSLHTHWAWRAHEYQPHPPKLPRSPISVRDMSPGSQSWASEPGCPQEGCIRLLVRNPGPWSLIDRRAVLTWGCASQE